MKKKRKMEKKGKNVYIVRSRTYYKSALFWLVQFLQSDWLIGRKYRLLSGSISSDMIGWCYKTFQSSFSLNKFISGPFRSRMRAFADMIDYLEYYTT